jgi:glycosyl hydrolase family 15
VDPRTPPGLPGLAAPFFGVAVVGNGGRTAAVDAYGNIVDLRSGPAGRALVAVPDERQAAGSVDSEMAIVARTRLGDGRTLPLWRADSVRQRYVRGTNVLRTVARFGDETAVFTRWFGGPEAVLADRHWLARARPLRPDAPVWAQRLYLRSLLVLRALIDRRSGVVAAGPRDGWAYVWPRDASAAAIALASAGYRPEARQIARFLAGLDLAPPRGSVGPAHRSLAVTRRATPPAGSPPPRGRRGCRRPTSATPGATMPTTRRATPAITSPTRSPPPPSTPTGLERLRTGRNRPVAGGEETSGPCSRPRRDSCGSRANRARGWIRPLLGRCDRSHSLSSSRRYVEPCTDSSPSGRVASDSSRQSIGPVGTIPGRRQRPGPPGVSPPSAPAAPHSP